MFQSRITVGCNDPAPLRAIRSWRAAVSGAVLAAGLTACASEPSPIPSTRFGALEAGTAAIPRPAEDYRIGSQDKLTITVFQVADLSLQKVQVDANGRVLMPLIGSVTAAGRTTAELAAEVTERLRVKYLQNPQVSVTVDEAVSQKVTIAGNVVEAGVYPLKGHTTLLQAVSMAKGPNDTANLHRVAVFRDVNGRRMAAAFDLKQIQAGQTADPEILGEDLVVVDGSSLKKNWREFVRSMPALGAFLYVF